jgi:thymidylate kinase
LPFKEDIKMIICIESFHRSHLETILSQVRSELQRMKVRVRFVSFPSDGPFGHQLRVMEMGRVEFNKQAEHLLRMVDRLDWFQNPINGLSASTLNPEHVIITNSQYYECLLAETAEEQKWVLEINDLIPRPAALIWLILPGETAPQLTEYSSISTVQIDCESPQSTVTQIINLIQKEQQHD